MLLTALPSTVQASIVFTSVAGGNVPAAMCSATASSLLGVFLTPLIAGFLLASHGLDISARSVFGIVVQLLLPFVAGQLLRPWIGAYLTRHPRALKSVDYGSVLILVYAAFSHGVVDGIWHQIDAGDLVKVALVDIALLASLLFAGHVGLVVIPLMLFHQMQLMVCASLARHYAARRITASKLLPGLPA
jgi:sodium/bile acid cotransporter 7